MDRTESVGCIKNEERGEEELEMIIEKIIMSKQFEIYEIWYGIHKRDKAELNWSLLLRQKCDRGYVQLNFSLLHF